MWLLGICLSEEGSYSLLLGLFPDAFKTNKMIQWLSSLFKEGFLLWLWKNVFTKLKKEQEDFPCSPVAKTPHCQCRRRRLHPWSGNWIPRACMQSHFSHVPLIATLQTLPGSCPWDSPGKNIRVGCHNLLQGILPTQGLKLRLQHWQVGSLPLCPNMLGKPQHAATETYHSQINK